MHLSFETLQHLAHPEKARILVHLQEHPGDSPQGLAAHLEIPLSTLYRFVAQLQSVSLVRLEEKGGFTRLNPIPFSFIIEPSTLREALEAPFDPISAYRKALGERRWAKVEQASRQAQERRLTLRQAARKSGLPYREFISVFHALAR